MFRIDVEDNEIRDLARDNPNIRIRPTVKPFDNVALSWPLILQIVPRIRGRLSRLRNGTTDHPWAAKGCAPQSGLYPVYVRVFAYCMAERVAAG